MIQRQYDLLTRSAGGKEQREEREEREKEKDFQNKL